MERYSSGLLGPDRDVATGKQVVRAVDQRPICIPNLDSESIAISSIVADHIEGIDSGTVHRPMSLEMRVATTYHEPFDRCTLEIELLVDMILEL